MSWNLTTFLEILRVGRQRMCQIIANPGLQLLIMEHHKSNAAMDLGIQLPPQVNDFISFEHIPSFWIAGSYGNSIFNFFMNLYTVFWASLVA